MVVFPEYRPDLFLTLASTLQLRSFDFRAEVMSRLGWGAGQLSLQDLNSTLSNLAVKGGSVINNIEALLSTKNQQESAAWINDFLATDWVSALLVPIVINGSQVPEGHSRVYRIPDDAIGEQTLISRLRDIG